MLTQEQLNVINDVSTGMAILEGLDDAIIGYEVNTAKIVYHYDLIVEILIQSGLDESEAAEYIDKNILTLKISNDNGDDITPTIFAEYPIFTEDDDNEEDINVGETEN
jgi:hypothetical protein